LKGIKLASGDLVEGMQDAPRSHDKVTGPEGKFLLELQSILYRDVFNDESEECQRFVRLLKEGKLRLYRLLDILLSRTWCGEDRVSELTEHIHAYANWLIDAVSMQSHADFEGMGLPRGYLGKTRFELVNQAVHSLVEHVPKLAKYWWEHHKIELGCFSCEGAEALNKTVKSFFSKSNNWHFNTCVVEDTDLLSDNMCSNLVHTIYDHQLPSPGDRVYVPPPPSKCGKCGVTGHRWSKSRCPMHEGFCPVFSDDISVYGRVNDIDAYEQDVQDFHDAVVGAVVTAADEDAVPLELSPPPPPPPAPEPPPPTAMVARATVASHKRKADVEPLAPPLQPPPQQPQPQLPTISVSNDTQAATAMVASHKRKADAEDRAPHELPPHELPLPPASSEIAAPAAAALAAAPAATASHKVQRKAEGVGAPPRRAATATSGMPAQFAQMDLEQRGFTKGMDGGHGTTEKYSDQPLTDTIPGQCGPVAIKTCLAQQGIVVTAAEIRQLVHDWWKRHGLLGAYTNLSFKNLSFDQFKDYIRSTDGWFRNIEMAIWASVQVVKPRLRIVIFGGSADPGLFAISLVLQTTSTMGRNTRQRSGTYRVNTTPMTIDSIDLTSDIVLQNEDNVHWQPWLAPTTETRSRPTPLLTSTSSFQTNFCNFPTEFWLARACNELAPSFKTLSRDGKILFATNYTTKCKYYQYGGGNHMFRITGTVILFDGNANFDALTRLQPELKTIMSRFQASEGSEEKWTRTTTSDKDYNIFGSLADNMATSTERSIFSRHYSFSHADGLFFHGFDNFHDEVILFEKASGNLSINQMVPNTAGAWVVKE
jgi:hypothetical protein